MDSRQQGSISSGVTETSQERTGFRGEFSRASTALLSLPWTLSLALDAVQKFGVEVKRGGVC